MQVYWAPLLDPSIGPFLEQLQARLAAGWEVAAAKGDGDDGEEDDIAVVFENAVTRSLTQRLLQAFANTQVSHARPLPLPPLLPSLVAARGVYCRRHRAHFAEIAAWCSRCCQTCRWALRAPEQRLRRSSRLRWAR